MKTFNDKVRQYWNRVKDFCVYKILHADDPPHRLALGIAVGMFVTITPLIGFQMVICVFLAWLLRANKLVGIPLVWISNPFTIIPIYYPCYRVGCALLGEEVSSSRWTELGDEWRLLLANPATTWSAKVRFWWEGLMDFIAPLCLGCLVVGLVLGVLSYYLSLVVIRTYRLRRWGQLMPPKLTPVDEVGSPAAPTLESATQKPMTSGEESAA